MKKHHPFKHVDTLRWILTTPCGDRDIAAAVGVAKNTVSRYRKLAFEKKFTWDQLAPLSPLEVDQLFNKPALVGERKRHPNWNAVAERVKHTRLPLQIIWETYCKEDPGNALSYSQFAAVYKRYRERLPTEMRQHHEPGDKVYVDYSGDTCSYTCPQTGKRVRVQLFVGVLPASSLIFATCVPSQRVEDFITANVQMLHYFGGVTHILVCDNLKAAVVKPGKDPVLQASFADFARYYDVMVMPARPYRPKDKATVESSVRIVQNHVSKPLADEHFGSLEALNQAIAAKVHALNERPMQEYKVSRRHRFDQMERHTLRPLPAEPYAFTEYLEVPAVPQDYHVCIRDHHYSVPHALIGQRLNARLNQEQVEIFHLRQRVARHPRSFEVGGHTTLVEHMPPTHRHQAARTPAGVKAWAEREGGHIQKFVEHQLTAGAKPWAAVPTCDGLRKLIKQHGAQTIQLACATVLDMKAPNLSSLKRILANGERLRNSPTVIQRRTRTITPIEITSHVEPNPETAPRSQAHHHGQTLRPVVSKSGERQSVPRGVPARARRRTT
jgi:transposase